MVRIDWPRAATAVLFSRTAVIALVLLAAGLPLFVESSLLKTVLVLVLLYAFLGQAWNIVGGYAGQVSLGHALFFGIGAYIPTYLLVSQGVSPWLGIFAGGAAAAVLAGIIGRPLFRLDFHYFGIATLALVLVAQSIFLTFNLAGGASGLQVPFSAQPSLARMYFIDRTPYYYIALALVVLVFLSAVAIERSRLGYYLAAVRNDPVAAASIGIDVPSARVFALVISAFFTAVGGAFYAQFFLYIDPDSAFNLLTSVLIMLVPVLGGVGTLWGPLVGAVILIPLSAGSQFVFGSSGTGVDAIVYAALIILVAVRQPGGVVRLIGAR